MLDFTLKEYLYKYPMAEQVAYINKPHSVLKDSRPIEVYCESILYNNKYSSFSLFNDGKFVGNCMFFPSEINKEDISTIGEDMIKELLSKSDFEDLDRELKGKCACKEYQKIYKTCDECEMLKNGECLGPLYSIPTHINSWDVFNKWNEKYGEGSLAQKDYLKNQIINAINRFMSVCGNEEELIKEILDNAKQNFDNKHKELFK